MPARIQKLLQFSQHNGLSTTLKVIYKNIAYELRWYFDRKFDRLRGTDTSDRIELINLDVIGNNRNSGVYYEPTPTAIFTSILSVLQSAISYRDFAFLDFGSGKGRTLLLASDYPFKAIIGIEFSRELHSTAESNIQRHRGGRQRCREVTSINCDAVLFQPPKDNNLFVYFYNPFHGGVMRTVLENIAAAINVNKSKAVLVYLNPLSSDVVEESGIFLKCFKIDLPYDYTREQQRQCNVYFNWQEAPGSLLHPKNSRDKG